MCYEIISRLRRSELIGLVALTVGFPWEGVWGLPFLALYVVVLHGNSA